MTDTPYHYVQCGLPNVRLLDGFELVETPYGLGVRFVNAAALDNAIAQHMATPGATAGEVLLRTNGDGWVVVDTSAEDAEAALKDGSPTVSLADLLAEMPAEWPRVEGWDEMPAVGKELL